MLTSDSVLLATCDGLCKYSRKRASISSTPWDGFGLKTVSGGMGSEHVSAKDVSNGKSTGGRSYLFEF